MYKFYCITFIGLVIIYIFYNITIYTKKTDFGSLKLSEKAVKGENLWIKNNCNACHQIYGLGGYLGPDLTNIYSTPGRSEASLKAFMISGVKSMPKFDLSESEQDEIFQFLKEIDQTGHYPDKNAKLKYNGWVEFNRKTSNNEE